MTVADAPVVAYLGLGANLGDRAANIAAAVHALARPEILLDLVVSPLHETDAVSEEWQPAYLNAVVRGRTHLSAPALLEACLQIEAALGRVRPRDRPKAARVIDIDLLLHGTSVVDSEGLKVPHPRLLERAFVLIPLAEVAAPGLTHPITGVSLTRASPSPAVRPRPRPG